MAAGRADESLPPSPMLAGIPARAERLPGPAPTRPAPILRSQAPPAEPVPHLLHLDSRRHAQELPSPGRSPPAFADAWLAGGPQYTAMHWDLHLDPLPHLADAVLHWPPRRAPGRSGNRRPRRRSPRPRRSRTSSSMSCSPRTMLLVGAPLYNYFAAVVAQDLDRPRAHPRQDRAVRRRCRPAPGRAVGPRGGRGPVAAPPIDPGSPTFDGWDHAVPVCARVLILGTALGMSVEVITTSLTLAETVPALAPQLDRARAELAAAPRGLPPPRLPPPRHHRVGL